MSIRNSKPAAVCTCHTKAQEHHDDLRLRRSYLRRKIQPTLRFYAKSRKIMRTIHFIGKKRRIRVCSSFIFRTRKSIPSRYAPVRADSSCRFRDVMVLDRGRRDRCLAKSRTVTDEVMKTNVCRNEQTVKLPDGKNPNAVPKRSEVDRADRVLK